MRASPCGSVMAPNERLQMGGGAHLLAQPVGSADEDAGGLGAAVPRLGERSGERRAGERLAALVERNDELGLAHQLQQRGAFLLAAPRGLVGAALADLMPGDRSEPQPLGQRREAVAVLLEQRALGPVLEAADRGNDQPHQPRDRCRYRVASCASADGVARPLGRPHLFQVVEFAHLGPEHVHDDVADVDQHPVALRLALDAGAAEALFLELALDLLGDGAHVPVRAARGDHHVVADRRFPPDVDRHHVLGLGVIEPGQDMGEQGIPSRAGTRARPEACSCGHPRVRLASCAGYPSVIEPFADGAPEAAKRASTRRASPERSGRFAMQK